MNNTVLFISEDYLKEFSPIASNVQNNALSTSILKAQTQYILPVLGKTLYDKLVNDIYVAQGVTGLTTNYLILLEDYITPALTEYALYEALIPLTFKFQNKGIGRMNDNFQETIDLDTLKYLRNEIRNTAQWHQERLIRFLCNNTELFPEYNVTTDDLNPDATTGSFNTGIYFKGKRRYNPSNPFSYIDLIEKNNKK